MDDVKEPPTNRPLVGMLRFISTVLGRYTSNIPPWGALTYTYMLVYMYSHTWFIGLLGEVHTATVS